MRFTAARDILARFAWFVVHVLAVSLICFSALSLVPGDPAAVLLRAYEEPVSDEAIRDTQARMGTDRPFLVRYVRWLGHAACFDFGVSFRTGEPAAARILGSLPATLELATAAFVLLVFLSLAAAITATHWRNGRPDLCLQYVSVTLGSVPAFWLGLLLVIVFSVALGVTPVAGRDGPMHLILPVMTLALGASLVQGRVIRGLFLGILQQNYIRTARARGLGEARILLVHVLKNALPGVLVIWGISFGHLLCGSVIVENIFSWPGMGTLVVESIFARDYPVLMGCVLTGSLCFLAVNALADALARVFDPRRR
ncbi:MAG: ABC transporter permease [Spirochaetes bacterium]|nr:ABC transporter permease [Spirochaetota bacterium]